MSGNVVFVSASCCYRTEAEAKAEAEAEAAAAKSKQAATEPEEPADLDSALAMLEDCLRELDELSAKDGNFPTELAAIESKHEALPNQELDSVEAIQSRSAEMSKLAAMRELGQVRQKKLKNAITAQEKAIIEIGGRAASLLEKLWWDLHTKAFSEAELE